MPHDHVGVMLDALLAIPVPDGYTSVYRQRYDAMLDHTFRDVTISPDGLVQLQLQLRRPRRLRPRQPSVVGIAARPLQLVGDDAGRAVGMCRICFCCTTRVR